jgi:ribosomal protein S18 acetylase RimI-like enzyme
MNAQLVVDQHITFQGVRPLDPRRDLNQVADLIEDAFAGELEAGGLAALRDLRMFSHMGPLVGLMARSDPAVEDILGGFVWVRDGQVLGNVTLQRADPYGARWQIANVAVAKPYRGQGIGRALMLAALERITERKGAWAVLQVRADNLAALKLYETLGFEVITREVAMHLERIQTVATPTPLPAGMHAYHHSQWQARYQLEAAAHSGLDQWWRPIRSQQYWQSAESRLGERLWELIGRNRIRRWVLPGEHSLAGWVSIDAQRWQGTHRVEITIHPACRGQLEDQLAAYALSYLADYPRWPIRIEQYGDHPELIDAVRRAGFTIVRNHLAMRKKMS